MMDAKQQEKAYIRQRKRQENLRSVLFFILAIAIPLGTDIFLFLWIPIHYGPLPENFATFFLVLIQAGFLAVIIFVTPRPLYALLVAPYERETSRLKRNWLRRYGIEVFAKVTEHKVTVSEDSEGVRTSTYFLRLTWQDAQTGQSISILERTSELDIEKYPVGSRLPVRYDPDDATFYAVVFLNVGV